MRSLAHLGKINVGIDSLSLTTWNGWLKWIPRMMGQRHRKARGAHGFQGIWVAEVSLRRRVHSLSGCNKPIRQPRVTRWLMKVSKDRLPVKDSLWMMLINEVLRQQAKVSGRWQLRRLLVLETSQIWGHSLVQISRSERSYSQGWPMIRFGYGRKTSRRLARLASFLTGTTQSSARPSLHLTNIWSTSQISSSLPLSRSDFPSWMM